MEDFNNRLFFYRKSFDLMPMIFSTNPNERNIIITKLEKLTNNMAILLTYPQGPVVITFLQACLPYVPDIGDPLHHVAAGEH